MFGLEFGLSKYKGLLDKIKELRLYREENVLKVHVKMVDETEITAPLSNYKTIIDAIARSKDTKAKAKSN